MKTIIIEATFVVVWVMAIIVAIAIPATSVVWTKLFATMIIIPLAVCASWVGLRILLERETKQNGADALNQERINHD